MAKEERITQLEQEIEQFDYQRLRIQEKLQRIQTEFQQELIQINQGSLTRQGEIICLKRLIAEEKKEDGNKPS